MGGDCSFTHTRSYWDHGTDGGGERWGSTQSAGRVCGAIAALTFYNLRLQTSGQNAPLVSLPIDLLDRKWPFKGFSFFFFFFFATPCQHAPLFLIWALLLRAIKWQTSPTSSHKSSSTVRWPVRKKTWLTLKVCGRWSNINRQYQQPIDYVLKRPDPAPKLVHFVPD